MMRPNRKINLEVMKGWVEEIKILEKQANCEHFVFWGADKKTGLCIKCGATIKKEIN